MSLTDMIVWGVILLAAIRLGAEWNERRHR